MTDLNNWHKEFLLSKGIAVDDEISLYKLKTRKSEFEELTKTLRSFVDEYSKIYSVDDIVDRYPMFNKLFVLYASEWWKRCFEGGHWTWRNILKELNISEYDLSPQKRSKCVRDGLKRWGLSIKDSSGKRFLGAVAIQGGLPIHFLTTEQGSIYRVLERLVRHSEGMDVSKAKIENWAEELKDTLPRTYRKPEIYSLLAQVVGILFEIKSEAKDKKSEGILNEWRSNKNRWLRDLPIAAPFEEIDRLISKLLGVVASTNERKREPGGDFLKVNRILLRTDDGALQPKGEIEFEEIVSIAQLNNLFGISIPEKLPNSFSLQISSGGTTEEVTLHKVIGEMKYRCRNKIIPFSGETLFNPVICTLQTSEGQQWSATPNRGEFLDGDLPWTFEPIGESTDEFVYLGQGSKSSKAEKLLIVLPANSTLETEADKLHYGEFNKLQVILIQSPGIVKAGNFKYRIKPNSVGSEEVVVDGKAVDWVSPTSMPVYRGFPKIYLEKYGQKLSINHKLIYSCFDGSLELNDDYRGIVQVRYLEQGFTIWKKKFVVIAEYSHEEFDYKKPSLRLQGWGKVQITSKSVGISIKNGSANSEQWFYEFDERSLPTHMNTRFSWEIKDGGAKIELPIPYKGVHLVNKRNEKVNSGSLLALNKLHGYHLRVYPGDASFFQLFFELSTSGMEVINRKVDINLNKDEHFRNIKLNDFKIRFQEILSFTSSLDDQVRVSVVIGGRDVYKVNIAQYAIQILRKNGELYLNYNKADRFEERPEIKAQRLHLPGIEELDVPVHESGSLDLQSLEVGAPWLLYPSKNSSVNTRPSFWSSSFDMPNITEDLSELSLAIALPDEQERKQAIEVVLQSMTSDLESNSWETLTGLASEFGHLPLSTLDVWAAAINNHDLMALFALGASKLPRNFIERCTVELPFMINFIPMQSWEKATRQIYGQIYSNLSDKPQLFKEVYYSNIQIEPWTVSQINNIFEITLESTFKIVSDDFAKSNSQMLDFLKEQYFQELLNNHSDESWPTLELLNDLIKTYSRNTENIYAQQSWKTVVYNTPILLAHYCISPEKVRLNFNSQLVRAIRTIKQFDEEWFSNMFNIALAQLYIQKRQP